MTKMLMKMLVVPVMMMGVVAKLMAEIACLKHCVPIALIAVVAVSALLLLWRLPLLLRLRLRLRLLLLLLLLLILS